MACKQETREIRGKQVFVRQWPASKAMDMQINLLTTMGDDCLGFVLGDWTFANLMFILQRVERPVFLLWLKNVFVQHALMVSRLAQLTSMWSLVVT